MRLQLIARFWLVAVTAIGFLAFSACGTTAPEPGAIPPKTAAGQGDPGLLKDEIPGSELAAVMAAHYEGLGHMERYEYRDAIEAFRAVHKRAPGWIPGSINLAIALLNDSGVKAEEAKKAGAGAAPSAANFDEALELLARVLKREPNNPYAHFCRGIMLEQLGNIAEAHDHFKRVSEIDPTDAASWYWMGATLPEAGRDAPDADARMKALKEKSKEEIAYFAKALELNPYLTPAVYRYAMAARLAMGMKESAEWFARWKRMNPDQDPSVAAPGPGDILDKKYGDMGRYGNIVNPLPELGKAETSSVPGPRFEAARPLEVKLAEGERWAKFADFAGKAAVIGWARDRFGPGISAFDADGDGKLDLYLASAVTGAQGVRDILLLNKGEGRFTDGSAAFGLARDHGSIGVAAGDFDADKHIDLFLTGVGGNRLLRNIEGKRFENISAVLKPTGVPALSLMARWVDIDQDGDLDLYVVNYGAAADAEKVASGAGGGAGVVNFVYRNDGEAPAEAAAATIQARAPAATAYGRKTEKGLSIALVPWPGAEALLGGARLHTGIAVLDVDNDRDLDLVLTAEKSAPVAILNDRLGAFHEAAIEGIAPTDGLSGLLTMHFDADGRADVVAFSAGGPVQAWRNVTERAAADKTRIRFESWPIDAAHWTSGQAVDLDLDGRTDLLGLSHMPAKEREIKALAEWGRNDGRRFVTSRLDALLEGSREASGVVAVDVLGDALPDILRLGPGEGPLLARNLGNGQHWLALALGGYWRVKPEFMRTNPHGIGTRVTLEGQGLFVPYDHTTQESGPGQSIAPVVLGMGAREHADLVHLRWPDGVMQCELSQVANQVVDMAENNRKTGSCPVLFTWDGRRYVCIGDFLGGGGMGYLVAPGVYSQLDRDEAMAITSEQLRESNGAYRLSIAEPMDEIAYLDHLRLDVVDRPPGVSSTPDERFAPEGPRPSGEVIAWRTAVEAKRATDLKGHDVTETLRFWDRRTVDGFCKLTGWIGYAEEHGIVLDFGDRLSGYGADDPLVLCLAGWVEYPYSQTNYAAATAGVALRAPVIERLGADGAWKNIEPRAGYPAGLPRMMTVDLTGKLSGERCVLRIKTNMECYYDQAFIAVRDRPAEKTLKVRSLPVARAVLRYRGYLREVSPDGEQPLLYDYDHVDPAPLARLSGKLTRFGDVAALLQKDDDQFCLVGPGDELRVEFSADGVPELAPGWTRSYVLRCYGYCKDADPFTAGGDTVEPLPWREMPAYPFDEGVRRPSDAADESYLRVYQTRPAGGEHSR
jgi:tetratricopeptide (TPR) repeat protein